MSSRCIRFSFILVLFYSFLAIAGTGEDAEIKSSSVGQSDGNSPTVNRKFIETAVTGEYVDSRNGYRLWISENEVQKVIFEPIQKNNDSARQLLIRQVINHVLTSQPVNEAAVKKILKILQDAGISTRCTSTQTQFIFGDAASRISVIRFFDPNPDQVTDMRLDLSERWSVAYTSFRSKQLARLGALPLIGPKESELAEKASLDELPYTASNIIYRISKASKPITNWCTK